MKALILGIALLGAAAQPLFAGEVEVLSLGKGRVQPGGDIGAGGPSNYAAGLSERFLHRSFFIFSVPQLEGQTITAVTLRAFNPEYFSPDPTETYELYDLDAATLRELLSNSDPVSPRVYTDAGSGTAYGQRTVSAADNGQTIEISLNLAGVAAVNDSRGRLFAIGGALITLSQAFRRDEFVFGHTGIGEGPENRVSLLLGTKQNSLLTLNSTRYCVGAPWSLNLSSAPANAAIHLSGTVNGASWEIPHWADTDASGSFSGSGTYDKDAAGKYAIRAETTGSISNTVLVEVVNCGWSSTGSLVGARSFGHTTTLLAGGKVLVAGSTGVCVPQCGGTSSAELYDPATGQWRATGSMNTPRYGHTAVRLANGKVLVAGGFRQSSASTVSSAEVSSEIYDPGSGAWSAAGNLGVARWGHAATLLADGRILVTGGSSTGREFLDTAELYDPSTNVWSPAGTMTSPRELHTALLLAGGKVLVFGGLGGIGGGFNGVPLRSAELYDPITGSWMATGALKTGRVLHDATLLHNGKVLVAGGERDDIPFDHYGNGMDKAELYDPGTGQWSATGSMTLLRVQHTLTLLPDGKVLAVGGAEGKAELYDPVTQSWSLTGNSTTTRSLHEATLLVNGKVLVVGGAGVDGGSNRVDLYDAGLETPLLTMNSTSYCVGDSWSLTVSHPASAAAVRLRGASNGAAWEIPQWGTINAAGSFTESGTFADTTRGTHTVHAEISDVWSSDLPFAVSNCKS